MNVDEMKAGRELDALVAERVMGWHQRKRDGAWMYHSRPTEQICPECSNGIFAPSTGIAAAWEVVDKLINTHDIWRFEVKIMIPNSDPVLFQVIVNDSFGEGWTIQESICRAALKAIQEQEPIDET